MVKAPVSEVFASHQGEGLYLGQPQIFIRFAGCNLSCAYCDTPKNQFIVHGSWFTVEELIKKILRLQLSSRLLRTTNHEPRTTVVALTGGEPLLQTSFLTELLPLLKKHGFKIYLETNGTLPEKFKKVKRWIDVVAMDIKLKSACGKNNLAASKEFLRRAGKKAFVKVIVDNFTSEKEIHEAVNLISGISGRIPLIFQPVTPFKGRKNARPVDLFEFVTLARKKLRNVFVVPQMHKLWKVR
jgi:7-carboxy-7-deazaguanine synthase